MRSLDACGIVPLVVACGWRPAAAMFFTSLLLFSTPALPKPNAAQPPAAKKVEDRVDIRLREADRAYTESDFARALELYRRIDALDSTVKTRLKIADCLSELGQLSEAYDAFDALQRSAGTTLDKKDKDRIEQALSNLRTTTAVLTVHVTEADAHLTVDGVDIGTGPLERSVRRKPGRVSVLVTKSGFDPWTKEIDISAGEEKQATVDLVPEKKTGTLVVYAAGQGPMTLLIDGKEAGTLPWTGDVSPGIHELCARSAHGTSPVRRIAVSAKGRTELDLAIVEKPAKLRVTTADPGAVIRIDGTPYGSQKFEGELVPGKHAVSVEQQGFVPSVMNLILEPGEIKALDNVVLERSPKSTGASARRDNRGIYSMIAIDGLIGKPTHSLAAACPAASLGGNCSSWVTTGGELDVHVGYSFGVFGVEGFMLGGTNLSVAHMEFPSDVNPSQSAWYGIARKERYLIFEPVFGGGAAGRVSTQGKAYRLSTALGFGLAWRTTEISRHVEATAIATPGSILRRDSKTLTTSGDSRVVPMFTWDSDIQLGDTPGTRVFLGIHAQVEAGSQPQVIPGTGNLGFDQTSGQGVPFGAGSLEIRRSPAFYFGPRFGLAMGN